MPDLCTLSQVHCTFGSKPHVWAEVNKAIRDGIEIEHIDKYVFSLTA